MVSPLPRYPEKRLIVFAGLSSQQSRLDAMHNRRVEAVMGSFELLKGGNWWKKRGRASLDRWPQYRFLDSGAFTLMRASSASRIKPASQPKAASSHEVKDTLDYKKYKEHFTEYVAFLAAELDAFDFVFELDMDLLTIESNGRTVPGIELTHAGRKLLKRVAGDKLIPVWHSAIEDRDFVRYKAMCREYRYVAIGSDASPTDRNLAYLCGYAHAQGTIVHGLGTSRVDVLKVTPFDTVDSTTWLSSVRFGQFAGWMFPRDTGVGVRQQNKAHVFRRMVEEMGYDPDMLLEPGGAHGTAKYEVAIALLQQRQDEAAEIPPPLHVASIFGGDDHESE